MSFAAFFKPPIPQTFVESCQTSLDFFELFKRSAPFKPLLIIGRYFGDHTLTNTLTTNTLTQRYYSFFPHSAIWLPDLFFGKRPFLIYGDEPGAHESILGHSEAAFVRYPPVGTHCSGDGLYSGPAPSSLGVRPQRLFQVGFDFLD